MKNKRLKKCYIFLNKVYSCFRMYFDFTKIFPFKEIWNNFIRYKNIIKGVKNLAYSEFVEYEAMRDNFTNIDDVKFNKYMEKQDNKKKD